MGAHVMPTTNSELEWWRRPKGFYLIDELIQSDAFRSLSKIETDLLLFIYSRRKYPSSKRKMSKKLGKIDYWKPLNGNNMTIPYVAIRGFFDRPNGMNRKAPTDSTITRAINKLMCVGFISPVEIGGHGQGNMSVYRIAHNWRVWRDGDGPCFEKAGLSRVKGFCNPGSGVFNGKREIK